MEVEVGRRAEDGGVGGQQGFLEGRAVLELGFEQAHIRVGLSRLAFLADDLGDEGLDEYRPVDAGLLARDLVHLLGAAPLVFHPFGGFGGRGVRQVAEHELVADTRPLRQQGAFDAHGLHCQAGPGVFGRAVLLVKVVVEGLQLGEEADLVAYLQLHFDLHLVARWEEFLDRLETGGRAGAERTRENRDHDGFVVLVGAAAERDAVEAGDRGFKLRHERRVAGFIEDDHAAVLELVPALADVRGVPAVPEADGLVEFRRSVPFVHGGIQRLTGCVHGALQVDRGEIKRFADFVETLGAAVFGQQGCELFVDAKQVVQRLLKFVAIQATEDGGLVRLVGGDEITGQCLRELGFVARLRACLFLGGHLA